MKKSALTNFRRVRITGIGSLPFSQHEPARKHILENYDIPFLPQIAEGDGDGGMLSLMLPPTLKRRSLSGFGVALTDLLEDESLQRAFQVTPESIAGCLAVQSARDLTPASWGQRLPHLKAQIIGPISLLQTIRDGASRPLWSAAQFHDQALQWTIACAQAIAASLKPLCEKLTLWLDEPMLGLMHQSGDRKQAKSLVASWNSAMNDIDVETGIHCCSEPPFDFLSPNAPQYLSFDFLRYQPQALAHVEHLREYIAEGGILALGVIAPMSMIDDPDPRPDIESFCKSLGLESRESLARHILLTPTCGTLLTPRDREVEIAKALRVWSQSLSPGNI